MKNILILVIIIVLNLSTLFCVNSLPQNYNETSNERVKRGKWYQTRPASISCYSNEYGCDEGKCWAGCAVLKMWCWSRKYDGSNATECHYITGCDPCWKFASTCFWF